LANSWRDTFGIEEAKRVIAHFILTLGPKESLFANMQPKNALPKASKVGGITSSLIDYPKAISIFIQSRVIDRVVGYILQGSPSKQSQSI